MDITFISDTHGLHDELKLTQGEVLIHAGDITEYGTEEEVVDFLKWFSLQPFRYKIFIAGNHDFFLEDCPVTKRNKLIPAGVIYLQNSSVIIEGYKIWGSPVTPYFLGMVFNARPGKEIGKAWNKIPGDTNILITHGPPKGIADNGIGSEELLRKVAFIKPFIHVYGHAHGCNGSTTINGTTFINAAMVNDLDPMKNDAYKLIAKPVILKIIK